jgi:class 3 adenylate cyclase
MLTAHRIQLSLSLQAPSSLFAGTAFCDLLKILTSRSALEGECKQVTVLFADIKDSTELIRVGLNSGEVVVRTIGDDLHMDYSAVGQTTRLAARMQQLATPGSIRFTAATLRLVEGNERPLLPSGYRRERRHTLVIIPHCPVKGFLLHSPGHMWHS